MYWRLPRNQVHLGRPCYLAILNLTPDSFSDGGLFLDPVNAINRGRELLAQGAHIIDIGAESTRPGSRPVAPDEEWARIAPVLIGLRKEHPDCTLSIDTRHPEVASLAINAGADIINDVTGFQDAEMLDLASNSNCGLIAMRIRIIDGKIWMPEYSEQFNSWPRYGNRRTLPAVKRASQAKLDDIDPTPKKADSAIQELKIVKERLLSAGIEPERILLDPGFGFGTTFLEDQALWHALPKMPAKLEWPVERFCIGISRKRFVAHSFGVDKNTLLDAKTAEMHKNALNIGYKVFRTHAMTRSVRRQ